MDRSMGKLTLGRRGEASEPDFFRGVLGELVLTFLFVFIGVGAAMTADGGTTKGSNAAGGDLTAVALGQALVVSVIATAGFHISGGHVNPAVTLSLAVGGHVHHAVPLLPVHRRPDAGLLRGVLPAPVAHRPEGWWPRRCARWRRAWWREAVFTFSLLLVIYATILDPRKLLPGAGPLLLTGLLVGANSVAGAVLSGASMNPARSFGPAVASGVWTHHWVYWVGPLAGGPLAVLLYECFFMAAARTHELLPQEDPMIYLHP